MILWRKIGKDIFETTCSICDLGLMIDDQDINLLAIFCLNVLSENHESHEFIRGSSGVKFEPAKEGTRSSVSPSSSKETMKDPSPLNLFSRVNNLLDSFDLKTEKRQDQMEKQTMSITLIASFYLNLSRNEDNLPYLLPMKLFKKFNSLIQNSLKYGVVDSTTLSYTNTIFSKMLVNPQSLSNCVEEDGYHLFIDILRG
mmetsp:Transcript_16495/g.25470  ORF Transcript_16495/g.25470 Transcript_16495/m.25470 type:complete len:199 (-) Transcript_16495:526-1122(-)